MNVLIIGTSEIVALIEKSIMNDPAFLDVKLTTFLTEKSKKNFEDFQSLTIKGNLYDVHSLENALEDQDIVIDTNLVKSDLEPTKNLVTAMQKNGLKRVISLIDTKKSQSKEVVSIYENSQLDYTVLYLSKFNHEEIIHYKLEKEPDSNDKAISRQSIVDVVLKVLDDPAYLSNGSWYVVNY